MSIVVNKTRLPVTEWQTESGSVVSIANARRRDAKSLSVALEPIQSGSGDPSPDNVRPISGFTGVNVQRTGKNIFGGETMADTMVAAVGDSTKCAKGSDAVGDYVSVLASWAVHDTVFFDKFKANTQYTVILKFKKSDNAKNTNLRIRYTDDSTTQILASFDVSAGEVYTLAFVSASSKSIKCIDGMYAAGTTYLYYDSCGIFEGALTETDFVPYQGISITVQLGQTVYGGTVDLCSGVGTLIVLHKTITAWSGVFGSTSYGYAVYVSVSGSKHINDTTKKYCVSNMFKPSTFGHSTASVGSYGLGSGVQETQTFILPSTITSRAEADAWLAGLSTPLECTFPLATPITFQLTPNQLEMLERNNTLWADEGDISVTYARIRT